MRTPAIIFSAVLLAVSVPAYAQHGGGHGGGGGGGGHASGGGHSGGGSTGSGHAGGGSHSSRGSGHHSAAPSHGSTVVHKGSPGGAAPSPAYIIAPAATPGHRPILSSRTRFPSRFPVSPVHPVFFGRRPVFIPPGGIFIGSGFLCDPFTADLFLFDPFFFDGFGGNAFCPFCPFGGFNPFFRHRLFFPGRRIFFGDTFFNSYGYDPYLTNDYETGGIDQQQFQPEMQNDVVPSERYEAEAPPAEADAGASANTQPSTLLVMKNGSMYAASEYWLENGRLHYLTNYGGENSVALEQLDLQTTVQMNWERGNSFVLRPSHRPK